MKCQSVIKPHSERRIDPSTGHLAWPGKPFKREKIDAFLSWREVDHYRLSITSSHPISNLQAQIVLASKSSCSASTHDFNTLSQLASRCAKASPSYPSSLPNSLDITAKPRMLEVHNAARLKRSQHLHLSPCPPDSFVCRRSRLKLRLVRR